jgi:hypothetical protein
MFLLSSLLEDPKVHAGARRPDQGSRVLERPRLWRGPGLDPAEHAGKLKSPETPSHLPLPLPPPSPSFANVHRSA